jgi:VanZ family protein
MQKRITWKDNIFLLMPFVIMFLLYWSSSMSYETQSLTSPLDTLLAGRPFENLLSQFEFTYAGNLVSIKSDGYVSFIEFFIRKGAHFFSFFFLGFFWVLGLRKRMREEWLVVLLSILLCIGYASFDELRQSFHPGRTGIMADVILDTAGAIAGVGIAWLLTKKKVIQ